MLSCIKSKSHTLRKPQDAEINLNWELEKFTLHLCSIKLFIYI